MKMTRSFFSLICAASLFLTMFPISAVLKADTQAAVGSVHSPSETNWGAQGNNGWYWMYQDKATGAYSELPYNTEEYGANQFSKHSLYEYLRISKNDAIIPTGAKTVFAFKAPSGGNVTFDFNAVVAPESPSNQGRVTMSVLKNGTEGVTIDGYSASSIQMEDDNTLRTYQFSTDVKENTMIYIAFECDYVHYLWLGTPFPTFSAKYNSINSEIEGTAVGSVYSPRDANWGTQGNNSWYWMYQDKTTGAYSELPYNTEEYGANQFSNHSVYEYLRISKNDAIIPAGAKLVFAFKAPSGGNVSFDFNAVVAPDSPSNQGRVTMSVVKNGTDGVPIDGYSASSIQMEDDNTLRTYQFSTDVKANTMIYITFECDYVHYLWLGTPFPTFSAKYNSINDETEEPSLVGKQITPSAENWGTQDNNGWHWMYQDNATSLYNELPFNTEEYGANQFSYHSLYEYSRISQSDAVIPKDAKLVFAYKAQSGGNVTFRFNAVAAPESSSQQGRITMSVSKNGTEGINLNGYSAGSVEMENDNTLRTYTFSADVKKNTMIYISFGCSYAHYLWLGTPFPTFSAVYNSINNEEEPVKEKNEYVGKTFSPSTEKWGTQGINGFYYMYNIKGSNMMVELDYNTEEKFPNAYSVHSTHEHLHFKADTSMHTASTAGTVLAYKAPVGGKVLVTVKAKGGNPIGTENSAEDMYLSVLKNETQVYPQDGLITLPRNDKDLGVYSFETDVEKGTMLYTVASCDDARAGAMTMSVTYISTNDTIDSTADARLSKVYQIDYSPAKWGTQSNNNWNFEFYDTITKNYKNLFYVTSKSQFVGVSEDGKYEHLLFGIYGLTHPSLYGQPSLVFKAPYSGMIELTVQSRIGDEANSPTGTAVSVYKGTKQLKSAQKTTGKLGSFTVSINVARGEKIAVLLDCLGSTANDTTIMRPYIRYNSISDSGAPTTGDKLPVCLAIGAISFLLLAAAMFVYRKKKIFQRAKL